jgi:lysophospholipase L1-like esterase
VNPEPFLRGAAFRPAPGVPYPRARDDGRLPRDTWAQACIPAGVRLELVGAAEAVEVTYRAETSDVGFRGAGGGLTFQAWRGGTLAGEAEAVVGEGVVRFDLAAGDPEAPVTVYLPEIMRPEVLDVAAVGGTIDPAPAGPRWVGYGDSILEGWSVSAPALGWGARVSREHGLDLVNMGYAGAARGELASAEHVASRSADVISISHGTNCWSVVPHTPAMMRAGLAAFLDTVRAAQPETPLVVVSPLLRPDAEAEPNRLGATLADLRAVIEDVVSERRGGGDDRLELVPGVDLVTQAQLGDGIHPDDDGHRGVADAVGPVLAKAAGTVR